VRPWRIAACAASTTVEPLIVAPVVSGARTAEVALARFAAVSATS